VSLNFTVVSTRRVDVAPGNEVLNIDLKVSYAEFLSMTKHLEKPYRAAFELPDGSTLEHNVGFAKGAEATSNARITMRNYPGEIPPGTLVTVLEPAT
jgi:hypothetical protein